VKNIPGPSETIRIFLSRDPDKFGDGTVDAQREFRSAVFPAPLPTRFPRTSPAARLVRAPGEDLQQRSSTRTRSKLRGST